MTDWDPQLYNHFRGYRAEPFELILARLAPRPHDTVIDLGCGSGENTIELARRVSSGRAVGIDSSAAMIARADEVRATLEPVLRSRLSFVKADFTDLDATQYSIVFSNAALQWTSDHRAVLTRWMGALAPGGQLVVQMPANHHETAQTTLLELAQDPEWSAWIGDRRTPSHVVSSPAAYRSILEKLGLIHIDCYFHTFRHPMASPAAVVEFCRATALRPFLDRVPAARHVAFIATLTERLAEAYGTSGPLIFNFRRLFLWGRRPSDR
jgi:trans-aconitate 2-methyltransferase